MQFLPLWSSRRMIGSTTKNNKKIQLNMMRYKSHRMISSVCVCTLVPLAVIRADVAINAQNASRPWSCTHFKHLQIVWNHLVEPYFRPDMIRKDVYVPVVSRTKPHVHQAQIGVWLLLAWCMVLPIEMEVGSSVEVGPKKKLVPRLNSSALSHLRQASGRMVTFLPTHT